MEPPVAGGGAAALISSSSNPRACFGPPLLWAPRSTEFLDRTSLAGAAARAAQPSGARGGAVCLRMRMCMRHQRTFWVPGAPDLRQKCWARKRHTTHSSFTHSSRTNKRGAAPRHSRGRGITDHLHWTNVSLAAWQSPAPAAHASFYCTRRGLRAFPALQGGLPTAPSPRHTPRQALLGLGARRLAAHPMYSQTHGGARDRRRVCVATCRGATFIHRRMRCRPPSFCMTAAPMFVGRNHCFCTPGCARRGASGW